MLDGKSHRPFVYCVQLSAVVNVGKSSRQVSYAGWSKSLLKMEVLVCHAQVHELDQARLSRFLRKVLELNMDRMDTRVTHTPMKRMNSSYQAPSC